MKQSYGLCDFKYLKLKIMDIPSRRIRVGIRTLTGANACEKMV